MGIKVATIKLYPGILVRRVSVVHKKAVKIGEVQGRFGPFESFNSNVLNIIH